MTPSHRHKKPRSGSPNQRSQRDIAPRDPRLGFFCSVATINQPQHTYIHQHHPHTMTPNHRHKKPSSDSPNWRGQRDITPRYPTRNISGSGAKIKYRRDSSGYENNGHYQKWCLQHSHSSRKLIYHQSRDIFQPGDMNDEDTVEAGWSVVNSTTTPSSPGVWQIRKQWIILSTVRISNIILVQDYRVPSILC